MYEGTSVPGNIGRGEHRYGGTYEGETGVGWDSFHFFSTIAENIYDIDLELTRQGRGQRLLVSCVVTSVVAT